MAKKNEGEIAKVNCTEVCATACPHCKDRCMSECVIAKKSGAGNCNQVTTGCCDECKDDCMTVCDLCAKT